MKIKDGIIKKCNISTKVDEQNSEIRENPERHSALWKFGLWQRKRYRSVGIG